MVGIGVIGFGYWGPNLVRNFNNGVHSKVVAISDLSEHNLKRASSYPGVILTTSADELLQHSAVEAVVIATPVFTHFDLAKKALLAGKHVLLEKPMASSVAQCDELIELASVKGLTLAVDHTFLYTGAVAKLQDLHQQDALGALRYFDSTRINLGLLQPDINVLWDLAPHDISILLHLHQELPRSVNATGVSHTRNGIENIAYMTVNYASGFIAHFHCSWTSPVKIRQILLGGDKKMAVFNDMEPTEKVKVYDTGFEVKSDDDKRRILVDYRVGDIHIPKIDPREALAGLAKDFSSAVTTGSEPISTALLGRQVVALLEAADRSLKAGGSEILL